MMRFALIPAVLALAACEDGFSMPDFRGSIGGNGTTEVSDPTLQLSDRERFVTAVEANGCVINAATITPIMTQASINRDQLTIVSQGLEAEGALTPNGDGSVRLTSLNCPTL